MCLWGGLVGAREGGGGSLLACCCSMQHTQSKFHSVSESSLVSSLGVEQRQSFIQSVIHSVSHAVSQSVKQAKSVGGGGIHIIEAAHTV